MQSEHSPILSGAQQTTRFLVDFVMSKDPALWNWIGVPMGPALALLYNLAVALFLVSWNEGTFKQHMPSLLGRFALFLLSLVLAKALTDLHAPIIYATAPVVFCTFFIGVYCIAKTRLNDVEGGKEPKFNKFCMRGKVVLVTGANCGIGLETARRLVTEGARVILACRSEQKAFEAMDDIKEYHIKRQLPIDDSQLTFLRLDLADFASIRNAANVVLGMDMPLDCLINNAGIMMGEKKFSVDGNELCMQANYLGHFLLTRLLLPKLEEIPGARVLNITSSTYTLAAKGMEFDDLMCATTRRYTLFGQYSQSKLANILFTKELTKRHDKLRSYAIHPGLVRTDVVRNLPALLYYPNVIFGFALSVLQKSPLQGAYSSIWAACTNNPPPNGSYIVNCKVAATNAHAKNESQASKLWDISEKLVGVNMQ